VLGDYRIMASGDVSTTRFGAYRRTASALSFQGIREAGSAAAPPQAGLP
jgi:hypothetical protein